jgi:hypothetical protein
MVSPPGLDDEGSPSRLKACARSERGHDGLHRARQVALIVADMTNENCRTTFETNRRWDRFRAGPLGPGRETGIGQVQDVGVPFAASRCVRVPHVGW